MTQVATILLVEDDAAAAAEFASAVSEIGAAIWHAENAADARTILRDSRPDLIVVDLSLPDVDGLVLCANLKTEALDVPFMVCSVGSTADLVLSFKLGAEDFVAKPYEPAELQARVESILKRHAKRQADEFAALGILGDGGNGPDLGRLRVDLARWRVTVDDRLLDLTPTEFHLLVFMARRPGEIISRQELARGVWGDESMSRSRTIDAYVRRIANKLAVSNAEGPPRILNIRGLGYQLAVPHVSAA